MSDIRKFYTSDLHWYHKNIVKFTGRPWTAEENNDALVELWNSQVRPQDIVYHLGDMFFVSNSKSGNAKAVEILKRLNGTIHCILGNHDHESAFKMFKNEGLIATYERMREIYINVPDKGRHKLVLCHYPLMSWNRAHTGSWHIFGHHHGSIHHPGKAVDVGLDGAKERLGEWRFWTDSDIIEHLDAKPIQMPAGDHHKIREE